VNINLSQGQVAIVDSEDYERLSAFKWYAQRSTNTFYAKRNILLPDGRRTTGFMHIEIMGALGVDHIDGDGLNNRKENLRPCSHADNCKNTRSRKGSSSQYKGVKRYRGVKWAAQIQTNGKQNFIGYFDDEVEAALAYDRIATQLHGEFARLNFPKGEQS
jgi:hypothetical protein